MTISVISTDTVGTFDFDTDGTTYLLLEEGVLLGAEPGPAIVAENLSNRTAVLDGTVISSGIGSFFSGSNNRVSVGETGEIITTDNSVVHFGPGTTFRNEGSIESQEGWGVYSVSSGSLWENSGSITGRGGIHIALDGSRIVNSGSIVSGTGTTLPPSFDASDYAAIYAVDYTTASIVNTGEIIGSSGAAIRLVGLADTTRIENYGLISGNIVGFEIGSDDSVIEFLNTGTFTGDFFGATSSFSSTIFANSGTVTGTIGLGGGDDIYKGDAGVLLGIVDGEAGDDTIVGGSAGELLIGGAGVDEIYGEGGNDELIGGGGDDIIVGGSGNDISVGYSGNDTIVAGEGDDVIRAGLGDDMAAGDAGGDTIAGGDGDDTLSGGDGKDLLFGGTGNDSILGGDGSDRINTGTGHDSVDAGAGNDTVVGRNATVDAGDGDDVVRLSFGDNIVTGGRGNDRIFTGAGNDELDGGNGDDLLEGGRGDDFLNGGKGTDLLIGDHGEDDLVGGDGDDVLFGGRGDDVLNGGRGNDNLLGDVGRDFFFASEGRDLIVDFDIGDDTLSFEGFSLPSVAALVSDSYTTDGGNAVFVIGDNQLTVLGVSVFELVDSGSILI